VVGDDFRIVNYPAGFTFDLWRAGRWPDHDPTAATAS
jgi:hypothetical protein